MSRMTYAEAIETVLRQEMECRDELMVFRPGAKRALAEDARDIPLPRLGEETFSMAVGAALCGMRPVLDLRKEPDAPTILLDAICGLPPAFPLNMTVLTGTEDAAILTEMPGTRVFYPKSPRQAAGFMRAALRSERICLFIADESLMEEEDEIPEDADFMLIPPTAIDDTEESEEENEEEQILKTEGSAPNGWEKTLEAETQSSLLPSQICEDGALCRNECAEAEDAGREQFHQMDGGVREGVSGEEKEMNWMHSEESDSAVRQKERISQTGMRSVPWHAEKFCALAKELEMPEKTLAARCVESVADGVLSIWEYEKDSFPGECVFLLNEDEEARLWIGCDHLCLTWNLEKVSKEKAAGFLHEVLRKLEKPTLLIYDKECEGK